MEKQGKNLSTKAFRHPKPLYRRREAIQPPTAAKPDSADMPGLTECQENDAVHYLEKSLKSVIVKAFAKPTILAPKMLTCWWRFKLRKWLKLKRN